MANAKKHAGDGSQIIVCGCLPDINAERLEAVHKGLVFGPRHADVLAQILKLNVESGRFTRGPISYSRYSRRKKVIYHFKKIIDALAGLNHSNFFKKLPDPFFIYSNNVYCLKVVKGCFGKCAYCAIPFAKGRAEGRPYEPVLTELDEAIKAGYSKFALVGDEITAYRDGTDGSCRILDLIDSIQSRREVETLSLESFEPSNIIAHFPNVIKALSNGRIPVFCSSVQSGSNHILELMNRHYSIEDYRECMLEIKQGFPSIRLRSEIIVGFPGEAENDFQASLELVKYLKPDFVHVYE